MSYWVGLVKTYKEIKSVVILRQNIRINKLGSYILGHGTVVTDCDPLGSVPEPILIRVVLNKHL